MNDRLRSALYVCGLWAAFAAFFTTQSYYYRVSLGQPVSLARLVPPELFYVSLWALLTPLILLLSRRYPVDRANWAARVPLHIVFALLVAVCQRLLYDFVVISFRTEGAFPWHRYLQSVVGFFDYGMFLYFIVLLIAHAREYYDRYQRGQLRASRLEADLAAARLTTLQMQLHPHFLFNTLNSIAVLIRSDPATAERMVARLAEFLRATLENQDSRLVPLRKELQLIDGYLEIEQVRFSDRLRVVKEVDPSALDAEVPFLILQPLVENAIRHGVGNAPGSAELRLRAGSEGETLKLEVMDTGDPGSSRGARMDGQAAERGHGLGLANTRARLRQIYQDRADVSLETRSGGGTTVTVRIPLSPTRQAP